MLRDRPVLLTGFLGAKYVWINKYSQGRPAVTASSVCYLWNKKFAIN